MSRTAISKPAPEYARDLNPTPEARLAMWWWGPEYARSGLGSMGFWDQLKDQRKDWCRRAVRDILEAAFSHGLARPTPETDHADR